MTNPPPAEGNTSYDDMPYPGMSFPQTHPDRLATISTLLGLQSQPINRCRLLEIGCAAGENLMAMAEQLPGSSFLGIDLSGRQIEKGRQLIERLALKNVTLRRMSVLDVDEAFGKFDYIVAHGLYSWVPSKAQDKILDICSRNLAPNGIAYISYNTYPGWHLRGMIRDMMCYHVRAIPEPKNRVQQARALLDFLTRSASPNDPYGSMLKRELEVVQKEEDSYLFHEFLEQFNQPCYFHEFVERASAKGLQYMAEAEMAAMWSGNLPAKVEETISRVAADMIQAEQYMDFVRNRTFRQTLLCHSELKLERALSGEILTGLYVRSPLFPLDSNAKIDSPEPLDFGHPTLKGRMPATSPFLKAALLSLLRSWPKPLAYRDIVGSARALLGMAAEDPAAKGPELARLPKLLLQCYLSGLIEFHTVPALFTTELSPKPLASPLARAQVELGYPAITNRRSERAVLGRLHRRLLGLLDGEHDLDALYQASENLVRTGELASEDSSLSSTAAPKDIRRAMKEALDGLIENAFLIA